MYDELIKTLRLRAALWEKMYDEDNVLKQAADAIEELSREVDIDNAAMTAMDAAIPRWIPVAERLPPYGDRILVTDKTGVWEGYLSYSRGFMRNTGMTIKDIYDADVTYWMPLPEPPKEET